MVPMRSPLGRSQSFAPSAGIRFLLVMTGGKSALDDLLIAAIRSKLLFDRGFGNTCPAKLCGAGHLSSKAVRRWAPAQQSCAAQDPLRAF